jgi:hypothetical protein
MIKMIIEQRFSYRRASEAALKPMRRSTLARSDCPELLGG